MSKIITKFICSKCNKELFIQENWGTEVPQKTFPTIKNKLKEEHKKDGCSNFKIIDNTTFTEIEIFLGKKIIYFDDSLEVFNLGEIKRVEYSNNESKNIYYVKNGYEYLVIENPIYCYNSINSLHINDIRNTYNMLAFLDNDAHINYHTINSIYTDLLDNGEYKSFIVIDEKDFMDKKCYEAEDIYKLSEFLTEFDKFNINPNELLSKNNVFSYIKRRIKEYNRFSQYWMDKYFL